MQFHRGGFWCCSGDLQPANPWCAASLIKSQQVQAYCPIAMTNAAASGISIQNLLNVSAQSERYWVCPATASWLLNLSLKPSTFPILTMMVSKMPKPCDAAPKWIKDLTVEQCSGILRNRLQLWIEPSIIMKVLIQCQEVNSMQLRLLKRQKHERQPKALAMKCLTKLWLETCLHVESLHNFVSKLPSDHSGVAPPQDGSTSSISSEGPESSYVLTVSSIRRKTRHVSPSSKRSLKCRCNSADALFAEETTSAKGS